MHARRFTKHPPTHLICDSRPESARPSLQGIKYSSTEVEESRERERGRERAGEGGRGRERAARWQTIGESLFPTTYYLLLLYRKFNAQAAACCCKPECLTPCFCATVQPDMKSQDRPGQSPTRATRVTPSHIGCLSGKVKLIRPVQSVPSAQWVNLHLCPHGCLSVYGVPCPNVTAQLRADGSTSRIAADQDQGQ